MTLHSKDCSFAWAHLSLKAKSKHQWQITLPENKYQKIKTNCSLFDAKLQLAGGFTTAFWPSPARQQSCKREIWESACELLWVVSLWHIYFRGARRNFRLVFIWQLCCSLVDLACKFTVELHLPRFYTWKTCDYSYEINKENPKMFSFSMISRKFYLLSNFWRFNNCTGLFLGVAGSFC